MYNAEREVAAASAEVGSAQAQRWPRLSLTGTVGTAWSRTAGTTTDLSTWSIGPLALEPAAAGRWPPRGPGGCRPRPLRRGRGRVPGPRAPGRERGRASPGAPAKHGRARRQRPRRRAGLPDTSFDATEARWRGGLASLVELEDARRTLLAAQTTLVALQHERQSAWVALYRAAGVALMQPTPQPQTRQPPRRSERPKPEPHFEETDDAHARIQTLSRRPGPGRPLCVLTGGAALLHTDASRAADQPAAAQPRPPSR